MDSRKRFASAAALIVLVFAAYQTVRAGSLEPPGPPAPTMQALDEVSPWIPINQPRATAGGITPGDSAGFPVTISGSGSYRLTGNLTVPNFDGIDISAPDVTIDLNGFTISGPVTCSGTGTSIVCSPSSGWRGIRAVDPAVRVVILNGTIRGFGSTGVVVTPYSRLEHLIVTSNGAGGISASYYSVIDAVQVIANGGDGINLDRNVEVTRSSSFENKQFGVLCGDGCIIRDNVSKLNGADGINVGNYGVVSGNVAENNEGTGINAASSTMISFNSSNLNGTTGGSQISTSGSCLVTGNTLKNRSTSGYALKFFNVSNDGYSNNVIFASGSIGPVQNGTNLGHNLCTPACP